MIITVVLSQDKSIIISPQLISSLNGLKEKIQEEIKIPQDLQILLKENLILSDKDFDELLDKSTDFSVKLFVKGTDNEDVSSVCNKYNINKDIVEVEIRAFTCNQPWLDFFKVSLGSKLFDIKTMLEDEFGISKQICAFHFPEFDETDDFPLEEINDDFFLVDVFFLQDKFNKSPALQLMFKYDAEDEWKDLSDTITIPSIRVTTFPDDKHVLELDSKTIIDTLALKRKVTEKLGIPVELQVFFDEDFICNESLLVYKFRYGNDEFYELKLLVLPTEDEEVNKICKENEIFLFKPVTVYSENDVKLFEYSFGLHSTVEDLFLFINKQFQIPVSHQVLICEGRELRKVDKITDIHVQYIDEEYSRYSDISVRDRIDIYLAVKGDNIASEICLKNNIRSLKTITVFYHDKKTLVEKYSVSDVLSLDELSMKLRSHVGIFPPILFFKGDYMKNQSLFYWKSSLGNMFFDDKQKCFNDNIDIVVCFNFASVLVNDDDVMIINKFCSHHKVSYLQKVAVQFENGKNKILDVKEGLCCLQTIKDVKEKLKLTENGSFFCNGKGFQRGKRLLEIYIKHSDYCTTDTLNLLYKKK